MSLIHIVKYDIKSALKSPWTYISFIFIIFLTSTFITSISQTNKIVEGAQILRLFSWTLSFLGILFLSKTVTRDFSQATIQKYLNDKINRIKYFFAKLLSITIIFLTFSIITLLLTVIFKNFINSSSIKIEDYKNFFIIFFLFFFIFGLFLYLMILFSKYTSLVFSLAIFIVLIIPMLLNFIPLIPNYGEKLMDAINYIPLLFLPMKLYQGVFTLNTSQVILSIVLILILIIIDVFYTVNKNV